ncbi:hypothetical protein [Nocardia arizonensis]|uniref:hypothetical protein n=1 Tax=Nocardia arizonensis TaxID=1141647 RepID=UPI0006D2182B|nr:hypothetical protein [Nocardia arizonensis]
MTAPRYDRIRIAAAGAAACAAALFAAGTAVAEPTVIAPAPPGTPGAPVITCIAPGGPDGPKIHIEELGPLPDGAQPHIYNQRFEQLPPGAAPDGCHDLDGAVPGPDGPMVLRTGPTGSVDN